MHVPYAGGPSSVHIPIVPTYYQWLNPHYLAKHHKKAWKKRYIYARNHCMKKSWSGRRRYKCFALHWAEFAPGHPNTLHDIRSRVQADCMKYRDHPTLRKACFEAHVNHYGHELLDERRLLAQKARRQLRILAQKEQELE